jgi:hypothetical protein
MPNGPRRPGLRESLVSYVRSSEGWHRAFLLAAGLVLAGRICLGLTMGAAWTAAKPYLSPEQIAAPNVYRGLRVPTEFPADALLGVWQRWDAIHHLNLARVGYGGMTVGESVFHPFYPLVVRCTTRLTGSSYLGGGLTVSTLAAVAALACFYRLVEAERGQDAALWSVVALAAYPTSFFLLAPYEEALYLALTTGSFLSAYRGRWWLAGVLGGLASITRGPGLLTPAALAWVAWDQRRRHVPRRPLAHAAHVGLGLGLPIATSIGFNGWRLRAGYPSVTEVLLTYSGLELTQPLSGIEHAVAQLAATLDPIALLEVASAFLFIGLAVGVVRKFWRGRMDWVIYMLLNLCLFLSKVSLVATSLQSIARYVLVLFPGFIVIGEWLSHLRRQRRFWAVACSSGLLVVLSSLYALWVFVG